MQLSHILFRLKEYIKYLLEAKGIQSIHSPFLFDLYKTAIKKKEDVKDYYTAEAYRNELLATEEYINKNNDPGAGPSSNSAKEPGNRLLSDEVESSGTRAEVGQLLYRFVHKFQPKYLIELGTNAGISTFYQLLSLRGKHDITFISIEGNKDLHELAKNRMMQKRQFWAELPEVNFINDTFENCLPKILDSLPQLDFAFIDGDHRKDKLIQNFNLCASKASENAVFILDDIRWSPDMLEAWEIITAHPKVNMSLDLFSIGIVFFNPSLSKQHIKLNW